jgi:hypothetical protein
MIILQVSHGLALISSCADRREAISEEKNTFKLKIQFLVFMKNYVKQLVLIAKGTLKLGDSQRKTLRDRSSVTLESESKMFLEDLPMMQRSVKSAFLDLGFSSSSELEKSSLENSKSLKAAHARNMIF